MWTGHTGIKASRLPPGKLQRDREGLNQRFPKDRLLEKVGAGDGDRLELCRIVFLAIIDGIVVQCP